MIGRPERTALYRIYDGDGLLLYIGISKDFGRRWKDEARDFSWWDEHRRMTVDWYDSRKEAEAAETAAIKTEWPRYNKVHAVRERLSGPEPILTSHGTYALSEAELRAMPVAMDIATASHALGMSAAKGYRLAKAGKFPVRIQRWVGGPERVLLTDIYRYLGLRVPGIRRVA